MWLAVGDGLLGGLGCLRPRTRFSSSFQQFRDEPEDGDGEADERDGKGHNAMESELRCAVFVPGPSCRVDGRCGVLRALVGDVVAYGLRVREQCVEVVGRCPSQLCTSQATQDPCASSAPTTALKPPSHA